MAKGCSRRSRGTSPPRACRVVGLTTISVRRADALGPTRTRNVSTPTSTLRETIVHTVLWPSGRWSAWHENSFSKYGTEGIDCTSLGEHRGPNAGNRNTRTPPSRIRNGSTPHSSLTALSRAWNQGSSRLPSHQSAVWSIVTCVAHIPLSVARTQGQRNGCGCAHVKRVRRAHPPELRPQVLLHGRRDGFQRLVGHDAHRDVCAHLRRDYSRVCPTPSMSM